MSRPFLCIMTAALLLAAATSASAQGRPSASVFLESDPLGAVVRVAGREMEAPAAIELAPGAYELNAVKSGFLPLMADIEVAAGDTVTISFVMLRERPEPPMPEDLDLAYRAVLPPVPLLEAERIDRTKWSVIENLAVFPLFQGVMIKAVSGSGGSLPDDEMIAAGAGLIAAAYVVGNRLHAGKVRDIERRNVEIVAWNDSVKVHNAEVDAVIDDRYAEELAEWEMERFQRGAVEVRHGSR